LESLFSDPVREQLGISASGDCPPQSRYTLSILNFRPVSGHPKEFLTLGFNKNNYPTMKFNRGKLALKSAQNIPSVAAQRPLCWKNEGFQRSLSETVRGGF